MASPHHRTIPISNLAWIVVYSIIVSQIALTLADPECTVICKYRDLVKDADCSDNSLTQIPVAGLCSKALSVNFINNEIQVVQGSTLEEYKEVKTMLFGFNDITEVPTNMLGNLTNLRHLQMNNNNIRKIATEAFRELHKLTGLQLDYNVIEELEPSAFDGLHVLEKLYLIHNSMSVIPSGVFGDLKNMTLLNINNNKISTLLGQPFAGLLRLEKLFLANNALTSVDMSLFKDLPLKELYLDNNNITTLHNIDGFVNKVKNLTTVSLRNNPLHCDCKLEPLRQWLRLKEPDNSPATCATPVEFNGMILADIGHDLCDDYVPVEELTSPKTTTPKTASSVGRGTGRLNLNSDDTWKIVIIVCVGFLVIVILIGSLIFIGRRRLRDDPECYNGKSPQNLHYRSVQINVQSRGARTRMESVNSETLLMGSQPVDADYETYQIPPDARGAKRANGHLNRNDRAPLVKQLSTGSVTTSPDIITADTFTRDDLQNRSGERPVRFSISEPAIPEELEFDSDGKCTNFGNRQSTAPPSHRPPPPPPQLSKHCNVNIPGASTGYLALSNLPPQKV